MSTILRKHLALIITISVVMICLYFLLLTDSKRKTDSTRTKTPNAKTIFISSTTNEVQLEEDTTFSSFTTNEKHTEEDTTFSSSTANEKHTEEDTILLLSTARSSTQSCELSSMESDGWFCESDDDWKRRKEIHQMQDRRNRNSDALYHFFYKNWEPTIHCTFDQRIGNVGDGGKWVCDVHKLKMNNTQPLIYSVGSQGDFSFERAIKAILPDAEIHTFDQGVYMCPPGVCTFHQTIIGGGQGGATKSIHTIIDELGHRQRKIDILKIDIEGSEYDAFGAFFKHASDTKSELPYIRQIQMEIHIPKGIGDDGARITSELFELFRTNNYAIFHKETNLYDPQICYEYAFIRLNPKFFISS